MSTLFEPTSDGVTLPEEEKTMDMKQRIAAVQAKMAANPPLSREERLQESLRKIMDSNVEKARERAELNAQLNAAFVNRGGALRDRRDASRN